MRKIVLTEGQVREWMVCEYLDREMMMPLKRLLNMSEEEQEEYLIDDFYYLSAEYMDNQVGLDELGYDTGEGDNWEIGEELSERINNGDLKEYRDGFIRYIKKYLNDNYWETPPFLVMDYIKDIYNSWLIHFTNNPHSISTSGFVFGTGEYNSLAYSGCRTGNKYGQGYNFAYDVDDFEKYYKYCSKPKYGEGAVLFRASGIKVWHNGDEETQVIFNGGTVNSVVPIYYNNGEWWIENKSTEMVIRRDEDLGRLVKWWIDNEAQYRRPVTGRKNQRLVFANNREKTYAKKKEFDNNYW